MFSLRIDSLTDVITLILGFMQIYFESRHNIMKLSYPDVEGMTIGVKYLIPM